MKRFLVTVIILAVIGGGIWHFFLRDTERAGAVTYRTLEVRQGNLENLISSSGTLSAVSTVKVGSQVSGTLTSIHVDFNDEVKKGQILAELDRSMLEATVVDARATVMRSRAQLAQARAELERNRQLYDKGFLSESEFLVLKTDVDVKDAAVASAEAGLNKAVTNLGYAVISSPIDGIVIHRSVDPGQTIAASFQTPELFIIAEDLSRMQIEVSVDESDIGQVRESMQVRFEVQAYYDEKFYGVVRQVRLQPETISNVVNYTVIVDADNTDGRLLPGMTATVDFIVDTVFDTFLIPNAAIAFQPDQALLEKVTNRQGKPEMKPGSEGMDGKYATVYLQDKSGGFLSLVFESGITDGVYTAVTKIEDGPDNPASYRAITGIGGNSASRSSQGAFPGMGSPMGGPPPGARGMRRSGL